MARILIAEDDPNQRNVLVAYLEREGHEVIAVADGRVALDEARQRVPDLVILDVMMPRVDGLDVCRVLRADQAMKHVLIMMVTARTSEDDLLLGLDLGADDYLAKPYSPRELTARVRVLLRRLPGSADSLPNDIIAIGALTIDRIRFEAKRDGQVVELTPREFGILNALAESPGRAFTRRELIDRAAGFDYYVTERIVDTHLGNLRKKIEPDVANPIYIQTVKGRGYRLAHPTDFADS